MKLREYIDTFPRSERTAVRERIGSACDVSESCVKHYANGTRNIPARHFKAIVGECEGMVQISDLLEAYDTEGDAA